MFLPPLAAGCSAEIIGEFVLAFCQNSLGMLAYGKYTLLLLLLRSLGIRTGWPGFAVLTLVFF